jgi:putative ABC transport system permease protein
VSGSAFGGSGLDPQFAVDARALPEVQAVAGIGSAVARVGGDDVVLTATDPAALTSVVDLDVTDGSLAGLGPTTIAVADDGDEHVGDTLPTSFADGTTVPLTVVATYAEDDIVGPRLVDRSVVAAHTQQAMDSTVFVKLADGVSLQQGRTALEEAATRYGSPDVQDRDQYAEAQSGGVDMLLSVVYALLVLAIVIALLGIANTTSLAIHERTRELGLLRAVGQSRAQLRSMVRWESTVVATFGTIGGLCLGVFLGWAMSQAGGDLASAFALPVGRLVIVLVLGAVAGVLAGVRPARRAARLDVLAAIATS